MPALNYAQAYSQALAQAYPYVLHFAALRSAENDSRYRWTGANTIQIPSLSTTGRVDADRDTIGVAKRNFNNAWEPKTLTNHRKWSTLVHPLDVDETNQVASIQNITKVFNEEQKFPEMDAYLISKLYAEWTGAGGTAERLKKELADSEALTSITSKQSISPLEYTDELEKQIQIKNELKEQEKILKQKERAAEQLEAKDAKIVARLEEQKNELARQKVEAGELVRQIEEANSGAAQMADAVDQAGAYMGRFTDRIKKLASRVFVFTLITTALRSMRTWMGKVIKTNSEARQSIAQLKGALLTLAQPLVEVIIPAFTLLVNILTRIVAAVAQFISIFLCYSEKRSSSRVTGRKPCTKKPTP